MDIDFFKLSQNEQRALLKVAADQLGVNEVAIEKDIWVCWVLEKIFALPIKMAFKGGTSLSKVYQIIDRFSEDVDITIDHENFIEQIDMKNTSRSQLKSISGELKLCLHECIEKSILPHLVNNVENQFDSKKFTVKFDGKESIRFYYPSALLASSDYVREYVLIEFGVRNSTEPNEKHQVKSLLAQAKFEKPLILPEANVDVLSVIRTFWEKATLIHVECHRKRLSVSADRLSRHWYDLAMLSSSGIGEKALIERSIFEGVLAHKKAFFNASYANYDDCLNKKFRLIPDADDLQSLKRDFEQMKSSGMFSKQPMSFKELIAELAELEKLINEKV